MVVLPRRLNAHDVIWMDIIPCWKKVHARQVWLSKNSGKLYENQKARWVKGIGTNVDAGMKWSRRLKLWTLSKSGVLRLRWQADKEAGHWMRWHQVGVWCGERVPQLSGDCVDEESKSWHEVKAWCGERELQIYWWQPPSRPTIAAQMTSMKWQCECACQCESCDV